jgi:hypothetical protein
MSKQLTPWHDKKGKLNFPYQPLRDLVFVIPTPPPEKVGRENLLHIPDQFRRRHQDGTGIVLAIGLGYQNDKGKWFRPSPELRPGVKVYFDNKVPWGHYFLGLDGKEHFVFLCGVADVLGIAI